MNKYRRVINYILHNQRLLKIAILKKFAWLFPDKLYLQLLFKQCMGYSLNLNNPQTFAEKLQWLKLYNRKPEYTQMVDKYAVKEYVANIIGKEYIIPTLGVWDRVEDIDYDALPNQFVLKTTHGGGSCGVVICKDKTTFDIDSCKKKLKQSLHHNIYRQFREWPYKNVKRRIIAEQFMSDNIHQDLIDYKFFCFNGVPQYCQVIRDRRKKETIDFYDMQWVHMPFVGLNPVVKNGLNPVERPRQLNTMIEICKKLAKNIPFVRIDLYLINNKIYFGEITFFPASGLGIFTPEEWNDTLGEMIFLSNNI